MIVYAVISEYTHNIDFQESCERIFQDFESAEQYIKSIKIDHIFPLYYRIDTYDTITGANTGTHYIDGYSNFDEI